jgi:hypothetical protein
MAPTRKLNPDDPNDTRVVEIAPDECPNGHPLGPGKVLVGLAGPRGLVRGLWESFIGGCRRQRSSLG